VSSDAVTSWTIRAAKANIMESDWL
jgi:hypothetical protein